MPRRIESHTIAGPAGDLEALLEEPEDGQPLAAAVVCHPHPLYGGAMHNKVVYRIARGLRRAGFVVLRFNFRGVGRSHGVHGNLTGEIEDAQAALDWLRGRYSQLDFALAGFSFGSRVVTQLATRLAGELEPARFVMAAGFPTRMGPVDYLESCAIPKIFLQSTHDQYGPRAELDALFARLPEPKQLIYIESADHFFAGALEELEEQVLACSRGPLDRVAY